MQLMHDYVHVWTAKGRIEIEAQAVENARILSTF